MKDKLTDQAVKAAQPAEKPYTMPDGGGMFLLVNPDGGKYWRLRYRFAGKQNTLGLGVYPEVTLKAARAKRKAHRETLDAGLDPSSTQRARKRGEAIAAANTFEAVAREWYERKHSTEVGEAQSVRNLRRLELYLFPVIGRRPIGELKPAELLAALHRIEDRGTIDTAVRVRNLAGQIFRYAIPSGRAERDIAADLKDALQTPTVKHHAAITNPADIGPLLRAIDGYSGRGVVISAALRLAPLLFVRPGELRQAEWKDFRLDAAEWDYTPSKGGLPMITPLPRQAVEILRELHRFTGQSSYLFPSPRDSRRPISDMTLNAALDRMGYDKTKMRVHGFRAMARTVLAERLEFPLEIIEMQLAHTVKDSNGRAYNRTTYLEQRRQMMQEWADYLDGLKNSRTKPAREPSKRKLKRTANE